MAWYEILTLCLFILSLLTLAFVSAYYDHKVRAERIRALKAQKRFYELAGDLFNYELNELYGTRK